VVSDLAEPRSRRGKTALLAVLALPILVACGGIADDFLPNTERGQLEVTVEHAVNTSLDSVTEIKINHRLRYMRPVLARTLPPGVEVHVGVAASDFGTYRFGGGWIFQGNLYLGRHAVPTELVGVVSSDVNVLTAERVPNPANPERPLVKLVTLKPGIVRLTFQTWRLDEKRQRINASIEDSLALTVIGSADKNASPAMSTPAE